MLGHTLSTIFFSLIILFASNFSHAEDQSKNEILFGRDIRPILSDNCFTCHGPDPETREAELRLDIPEGAFAEKESSFPIKPGDSNASMVMQRILSKDPDEIMPPHDSDLNLNEKEIHLIKKWIDQGAKYESHWAFQKIIRPAVPKTKEINWIKNPIDSFILKVLEKKKIEPSTEATRETLIRRVSLDLTGLPPTLEELDNYLEDQSPDAYEKVVNRLLASPHYGERWGRHWLDQARYADSNGYSVDTPRSIWPYRDWVINAFNKDLPFDQFTIEQIAGDLLPNPTREQLIATGFHRNSLVNQEGGTDNEQFRNEAVVDRVNTTSAVWLGLTLGCAQCHDHKYDSLTQKEFYEFFDFFNQGEDVNTITPILSLSTPDQVNKISKFNKKIKIVQKALTEYEKVFKTKTEKKVSKPKTTRRSAKPKTPIDQPVKEKDKNKVKDKPPTSKEDLKKKKEADPHYKKLKGILDKIKAEKKKLNSSIPNTMIMRDLKKQRETHIHIRGSFLSHGERVSAGTPASLHPIKPSQKKKSRLDLAHWLVSPENPLTARVTVNRIWMHYFGLGIVETENDFGVQSSYPTHPKLLDWLSNEFIKKGWSQKHIHRLILTSATYRQSSYARPELNEIDPRNLFLSHQSRMRIDAEIVRDISLAVSGLLSRKIGGKSVYPPQPDGVYSFTQRKFKWDTSKNESRFRRGMYTFFMRSAPYPMLTVFDTPRFNTTCTQRSSSNTPLQSLTMANDEALFEMANALGIRILSDKSKNDLQKIKKLYRLCFSRNPESDELEMLAHYLNSQRKAFSSSIENAQKVSGKNLPENLKPAEAAAWTMVSRVLLNLDEFITRE